MASSILFKALLFVFCPFFLFSEINILFIGDSNTRGVPYVEDGWVYKLKNDVDLAKYNIIFENYAFGFATTSQCEQVLTELLQHHKYDIAFYNAGLVDILFKNISFQLLEESMDRSIRLCLKNIPVVFFGMINFTCWTIRRNEDPDYIQKANDLFLKMAKKYPVIPYEFLTTDLLCHEKCNVGDWIHTNELGTQMIYIKVKEQLLHILTHQN